MTPFLVLAVVTEAFVDLRVRIGRVDPPLADVAALLAVLWARPIPRIRGAGFFALFLAIALLSLWNHPAPLDGLWWLLRKPVFAVAVFFWALPGMPLDRAGLAKLGTLFVWPAALLVIGVSARLWWNGWYGTPEAIFALTNNHKAIAVALAPWAALLWALREDVPRSWRAWTIGGAGLAVFAVFFAVAKAPMLVVAFAFAAQAVLARGLRPAVLLGLVGVVLTAAVAATWLPWLLGNPYMADALDMRRAIDARQWDMFNAHPWLGHGAGLSVDFPTVRGRGLDAHGIVQKLAGETGILGLAAYAAFVVALVKDTAKLAPPLFVFALSLHLNLLFSTEAFTASHGVPLGLLLALCAAKGPTSAPPQSSLPSGQVPS